MTQPKFKRLMAAILSGSGGGGAQQILDTPLGTAGTGIYAGMTLVAGMDFASSTIANTIATQATPKNKLWASHGYTNAGGQRSPLSGALAAMTDPSADYTGWHDSGRGIPVPYDNGLPQQIVPITDTVSGTTRNALRLHAVRQSTAEKAAFNPTADTRLERGSMVHTLSSLWWCAPAKINVRAAIPTGPAGWHPTIWAIQIQNNNFGYNGSERGWECDGSAVTSAYEDPHNAGVVSANGGSLNIGMANRSAAPHDWCMDENFLVSGKFTYYVDGVQVNQLSLAGASNTFKTSLPSYAIWTSHIGSIGAPFETYSAASWAAAGAAGANFDILGIQVWVPTGGKVYTPLVTIPDQLTTPGAAFSYTTPASVTLWGVASVASQYTAVPIESEEPGNTDTGWTGSTAGLGLPAWLTATPNANGSITFSGTVPNVGGGTNISGALQMALGYCPSGNACVPATFRIVVAPCFVGSNVTWTQNSATSYDLYMAWDLGRNTVAGAANSKALKGLTVTGLPTGMALGNDGNITGTPPTVSSGTVTTTSTNNDGQTTSATFTYSVTAAASSVAAPTGITGTLVAHWDPNDAASITQTSGSVTAIAPSTSSKSTYGINAGYTLANAGAIGTCPTLVARNGKQALRFTGSASQFLALASNLGIPTNPLTLVLVFEHATTAASQAVFDLAVGGGANVNVGRHVIISSTAGGVGYRKADNSGSPSSASVGTSIPTGIQLLIARGDIGTSAARLNLNGVGTAVVAGTTTISPSGMDTTTLGAAHISGGNTLVFDGWIYAVLAYASLHSDADVEATAANWATPNFGTTNAA